MQVPQQSLGAGATLASPTAPLPPVTIRRISPALGFIVFALGLTYTSLSTIVCGLTGIALLALGRGGETFYRVAKAWASGIIRMVGVTTEIHFEAPLPDGPVIFVCNHQSIFDILVLFQRLPRWFVFVAKKSIFRYPFLGWAIAAARYIPVDRDNRADAIESLRAAAARIREGLTITVFPEGTRSSDGSVLPFKKGPFMVALQAGVPIVPVAIHGSLEVTPKHRWYVCPNTIRILVGPPISVTGLGEADRDALISTVRAHVIRLNRRLGGPGGDESSHIAAAGKEGLGHAQTRQAEKPR